MVHGRIAKIFAVWQADNPLPTTELSYNSAFELLIAVILSAQATDKAVNRATATLFPCANTPQAILAMGEEALSRHIKHIGLYNTKARNVIATCTKLINDFNGMVPSSRAALMALPGVGRKTANVVLNTMFHHVTIAVDTHVARVARRLHLVELESAAKLENIEQGLLDNIPPQYLMHAHHWLILHGRYVCTAKRPKCASCKVRNYCPQWLSEVG